ncbi:MAG: hypothetical protein AMXMBFR25_15250 [Lysobacterales bacterium]
MIASASSTTSFNVPGRPPANSGAWVWEPGAIIGSFALIGARKAVDAKDAKGAKDAKDAKEA